MFRERDGSQLDDPTGPVGGVETAISPALETPSFTGQMVTPRFMRCMMYDHCRKLAEW